MAFDQGRRVAEDRTALVRRYAEMQQVDPSALYCAALAAYRTSGEPGTFEHAVALAAGVMRAAAHARVPLGDVGTFRAEASQVHNTPLAVLCTKAVTGDDDAHRRVTAIMAGQGDPGTGPRYEVGDCGWCEHVAVLVAALGSDTDTYVCAKCHDDPRIPTVSLVALRDETPVYVITRGDLTEMAWRDVTGQEASVIAGAIVDSGVRRSVSDVVNAVCGPHPVFSQEDE
jgi:hypothetical protein